MLFVTNKQTDTLNVMVIEQMFWCKECNLINRIIWFWQLELFLEIWFKMVIWYRNQNQLLKHPTVRFGKFFYELIQHIWNVYWSNDCPKSTVHFCEIKLYSITFQNHSIYIALKNTIVFNQYLTSIQCYWWNRHKIYQFFRNFIKNGIINRFDAQKNDWAEKRYPCTKK